MTPTAEWTAADEDDADRARAVFRDRGDIINRLITERDEARAQVAAVEALADEMDAQPGPSGLGLYGWFGIPMFRASGWRDGVTVTRSVWSRRIRETLASVGRTEPETEPVHWIGDAPTSLHGNGAASFTATTRFPASVTCSLCKTLLARGEHLSGRTEPEGARCPGCGSATCQWKRLECESPVNHEEHRPLEVRRYDGWIDCVVCSCDPRSHPTTSIWLETHWSGDREAGVQVLRDLIAKQAAAPAPEGAGDRG